MSERFIPPHGGYKKLLYYQKALADGGLRERMTRARLETRRKKA